MARSRKRKRKHRAAALALNGMAAKYRWRGSGSACGVISKQRAWRGSVGQQNSGGSSGVVKKRINGGAQTMA
jgi:hypothetical protein